MNGRNKIPHQMTCSYKALSNINLSHELVLGADKIDWGYLDDSADLTLSFSSHNLTPSLIKRRLCYFGYVRDSCQIFQVRQRIIYFPNHRQ